MARKGWTRGKCDKVYHYYEHDGDCYNSICGKREAKFDPAITFIEVSDDGKFCQKCQQVLAKEEQYGE